MFKYEDEVRIVYFNEGDEMKSASGMRLKFDFEQHIESVRVHPQADPVFFETVHSIVEKYAPNFKGKVTWSDMKLEPPF